VNTHILGRLSAPHVQASHDSGAGHSVFWYSLDRGIAHWLPRMWGRCVLLQTAVPSITVLRLQAMSTQEANRAASNKMPPLWAAAAIVLLGWNEFLTVLYNPLWLFIGLITFLFGKVRS